MLYPLQFHPIYKEMVWGGQKMAEYFGRELPYANTGESWDITCRTAEMGIVSNGPLAGRSFSEVINIDREKYLGRRLIDDFVNNGFPLLIKIIDAKADLSVQVHPSDHYANELEQSSSGKNEMWYVLDAPEGSSLVIGLKDGVREPDFRSAIEHGAVEQYLNYLPVKAGDVLNIPSGLVHAITKGVMVAEIQQNSDITYRMYDYNRIGLDGQTRELHLEKAIRVTDFDNILKKEAVAGLTVKTEDNLIHYYIANRYFAVCLYDINSKITEHPDGDKFIIFTCVSGSVILSGGGQSIVLSASYSAFIPAGLSELVITGKGRVLKSFIPDIHKDFVEPLLTAGYDMKDIEAKICTLP